jgi:hypothetical protein
LHDKPLVKKIVPGAEQLGGTGGLINSCDGLGVWLNRTLPMAWPSASSSSVDSTGNSSSSIRRRACGPRPRAIIITKKREGGRGGPSISPREAT